VDDGADHLQVAQLLCACICIFIAHLKSAVKSRVFPIIRLIYDIRK
jgi:hypothetical protein